MSKLDEIREKFKKDIYATQTTGIEILDAKKNYSKCSLKLSEKHMNLNNTVMGGAIFTLADFAFAVAANVSEINTVSLSSQITFLGVAKGDTLIAEAKCIKSGRTTCFFQVTVKDNLDTDVASMCETGFKLKRQED